MGEYAKYNGKEVKIGTCESMYYLRFEDRLKVQPLRNSLDPAKEAHQLRFRLPFPDEDGMEPGSYEDYNRALRLYRTVKDEFGRQQFDYTEDFALDCSDDPGTMQLHNEAGLLVNVKCSHGQRLPEGSKDIQCHWNGKSWFLELAMLRGMKIESGELRVFPVVHCRFCRNMWRFEWADVWEYLTPEWHARFREYAAQSMGDHDLLKSPISGDALPSPRHS